MSKHDVLVIGSGVSGACFAYHAARSGRSVLVVEKEARVGGSLHSERTGSGFWYELGAHTCYNSYGAFLEVLEGCGLLPDLLARGKPVLRFLEGDEVVPGKNLFLLLKLFGKLELLGSVPRWFGASKEGETVRSFYSRFVGKQNYERVLGPMLSAVPSQTADEFPADMLFKKRERREDVRRSFTLPGGLQSAVEAVLRRPGIETRSGSGVAELARVNGGFAATLEDGSSVETSAVALAVPPGAAAKLLAGVAPEAARHAAGVREVRVDSLGCAVRAEKTDVPYSTFLIPLRDVFHSVVTRDVVSDADWRGFAFHFRPGMSRDERLRRATEVLGVGAGDLEAVAERTSTLPSPVLGHADVVASLDRALASEKVALTGNWFTGLSIEDCAQRSRDEWRRVEKL